MMNVNVSPRRGVRVAPAVSNEYTVTVVTAEEVTTRNAAFEAAYAAARREAVLESLLAEAMDAAPRLKNDPKSQVLLGRAATALQQALSKEQTNNEAVYRAAEEAGKAYGALFEHADMLQYVGQVDRSGCGLRNQGLRAVAWALEHGVYADIEGPVMETHLIVGHIRAIGRG